MKYYRTNLNLLKLVEGVKAEVEVDDAAVFVLEGLAVAEGLGEDEDVEGDGGGVFAGGVGDGYFLGGVGGELDKETVAGVAPCGAGRWSGGSEGRSRW